MTIPYRWLDANASARHRTARWAGAARLRYMGRLIKNLTDIRLFNAVAATIALLAALLAVAPAFGGAARAEGTIRILALGDSLTAGYGLAAEDSFPARLQAALRDRGAPAEVIDAGVSGDTSAGGRARLDWVLASAKPAFAIVELGANDGLRGLAPAETRANLEAILTRLKAAGVGVLIAGMIAPPNLGREYGDAFNRVFPELARAHDAALYPFFLDGVAARAELLQADGLHPNARGVREIVRRMAPAVARLIAAE